VRLLISVPTTMPRAKTHRFFVPFADYVADYENPISPEILRTVNSRVVPGDKNDHLLLPPEVRLPPVGKQASLSSLTLTFPPARSRRLASTRRPYREK
jgi:hypothetical protein